MTTSVSDNIEAFGDMHAVHRQGRPVCQTSTLSSVSETFSVVEFNEMYQAGEDASFRRKAW